VQRVVGDDERTVRGVGGPVDDDPGLDECQRPAVLGVELDRVADVRAELAGDLAADCDLVVAVGSRPSISVGSPLPRIER
jgi:hypothetical protein